MALVAWLFEQQRMGIKPGLGRVKALLKDLDYPDKQFKPILIAGTNGKGSTAASLASILSAGGYRTGLFTSPHLSSFNERFLIDAAPLALDTLGEALAVIKPKAERLEATFFEIVTALACYLFAQEKVDYAVMEAGMGGLNDATNALEPVLSLITNVGLDHMAVLGDSVEAIAKDKAGIMRPGVPTFSAATGKALAVLEKEAEDVGCNLTVLIPAPPDYTLLKSTWEGTQFRMKIGANTLTLFTPLIGEHQGLNAALATLAANALDLPLEVMTKGLKKTRWSGRLELLSYKHRRFLLDGAHNIDGAEALAKTVDKLEGKKVTLLVSVMKDKKVADILSALKSIAKQFIFTKPTHAPRAADPIALHTLEKDSLLFDKVDQALEQAILSTEPDELIVVAGSLYLVGEVRPLLLGNEREKRLRFQ